MNRKLWVVVLCAGSILGIVGGLRSSLGLFLTPISADLGLGREVFALGVGLLNLIWGLGSPLAGAIADRHGTARTAAVGAVLYAGGLLVMAQGGHGGQLVLGGSVIGLGAAGAGYSVVLGAVGRAAPEHRRSLALGLAAVGGSLGQFLAIPYTYTLIHRVGWYASLLVLAATALAMLPLVLGIRGAPAAPSAAESQSLAQALREARAHGGYWMLTIGFFVCGFQLSAITVHLPAYLSDLGQPPSLGAIALTVVGFMNIFGTLLCSGLGNALPKQLVLSAMYLTRAVTFALFLLAPLSPFTVVAMAVTMGTVWLGTLPLTSAMIAQIFGPRYLSTLFGITFLSHQIGGFCGAWLTGFVYDRLGSYEPIWWACAASALGGSIMHALINARPVVRQLASDAAAG
jgi:predicted MFS family arabinose efflux permease